MPEQSGKPKKKTTVHPIHQNLGEYISLMDKWEDRLYLIGYRGYREDPWKFNKVRTAVLGVSGELQKRRIKKGNRILLCGKPSPEWVIAYFSVLHRGAVVIPLDPGSSADFILSVLKKTAPALVISSSDLFNRETVEGLLQDNCDFLELSSIRDFTTSPVTEAEQVNRDDLAEIVFTSGTTSQPKGVMLTHNNILSNLEPIENGLQVKQRLVRIFTPLRLLCTVPFSHMFGQVTGIFLPLLLGSRVYFAPDTSPAALVRTIRRDKILTLITVPRVMKLLADYVKADLTARGKYSAFERRWEKWVKITYPLRVIAFLPIHRFLGLHFWSFIVGGAPLDPETHEFWRRIVYAVFQGYGLTETAPIVTMFNPFRHNRSSVGETFPGQEVKVASDGEILVRGRNVMEGYFNDPAGTDSVLKDGWLRTGDIGEVDEKGQLYIKGRKKDVIVTSDGHNVYPEDIENALNTIQGVREAVIIGKPEPAGETIHAVLLLESAVDPARIIQKVNSRLRAFQRIRSYSVWDEADFPRTATLKVQKNTVKKIILEEQKSAAAGTDNLLEGLVADSFDQDARLVQDLGMDSLDMVEVVCRMEKKYGVSLDETLIGPDTTLRELEALASHPEQITSLPMPRWARRRWIGITRRGIMDGILLPLFRIVCRIRVFGLTNLETIDAPRILCVNHCSDLDPMAILLSLPVRLRKLIAPAMGLNRFYAYFTHLGKAPDDHLPRESGKETASKTASKKRVCWIRRIVHCFLYHVITFLFNSYPFPQGTAYRPSLEYSGELLDAGFWLLLFPEGTVNSSGTINPFKPGVAVLAERAGAPVVPVGMQGMHHVLPPGKFIPRRGMVSVSFGKPLYYNHEGHDAFTAKIKEKVQELCEQIQIHKAQETVE